MGRDFNGNLYNKHKYVTHSHKPCVVVLFSGFFSPILYHDAIVAEIYPLQQSSVQVASCYCVVAPYCTARLVSTDGSSQAYGRALVIRVHEL